jgi:hypothetical protein
VAFCLLGGVSTMKNKIFITILIISKFAFPVLQYPSRCYTSVPRSSCGDYYYDCASCIAYTTVKADLAAWFHNAYPTKILVSLGACGYHNGNNYLSFLAECTSDTSAASKAQACAIYDAGTSYYTPVSPEAAGFACPLEVSNVECWELGKVNPQKMPAGVSDTNAIVVRYKYNLETYVDPFEGIAYATDGCAGLTIEGIDGFIANNPFDTTVEIDGIDVDVCRMGEDSVLIGTCSENGLSSSNDGCTGTLPFQYSDNNDSIIIPCSYDDLFDDPDERRPDDSLTNENDTNFTGTDYVEGVNRLSSDMREENALNREIMNDQLDAQKETNSKLFDIKGLLVNINNNMKEGFNNVVDAIFGNGDTSFSDSGLSNWEGSGYFGDTTGIDTIGNGNLAGTSDINGFIDSLRGELGNDSLDTLINDADTIGIGAVFEQFEIDIYSADCDCNSEWFEYEDFPFIGTLTIDICPYNVDTYTKILFKIISGLTLFLFYRKYLFKVFLETL